MSAHLLAEPPLERTDPVIAELIEAEIARQSETICLIPSEKREDEAAIARISDQVREQARGFPIPGV